MMNNQIDYILKRTDRRFYSFQSVFYIPKDLQEHFRRKQFKVSLKSVIFRDSKRLSLFLHGLVEDIYQEMRMGKLKNLTLDEVKSILKIEVDKSVLHIQHIETGTGITENQVLQSLQHITKEETQFKRTLEDERKKIEGKVDREMSKILKSNGFKIDKKSLEFKTLRKRVIELKLLRFSHKKDFVSGKQTDLNKFLEECDSKFRLGISNDGVVDKKNAFARNTHLQPDEPTDLELLAKLQTSESILGSRILHNDIEKTAPEPTEPFLVETKLIREVVDEFLELRKGTIGEKMLREYRVLTDEFIEIIGNIPLSSLSKVKWTPSQGQFFS